MFVEYILCLFTPYLPNGYKKNNYIEGSRSVFIENQPETVITPPDVKISRDPLEHCPRIICPDGSKFLFIYSSTYNGFLYNTPITLVTPNYKNFISIARFLAFIICSVPQSHTKSVVIIGKKDSVVVDLFSFIISIGVVFFLYYYYFCVYIVQFIILFDLYFYINNYQQAEKAVFISWIINYKCILFTLLLITFNFLPILIIAGLIIDLFELLYNVSSKCSCIFKDTSLASDERSTSLSNSNTNTYDLHGVQF